MLSQVRLSSEIWYHFAKEGNKGRCRYCGASIAVAGESTGNLKGHLKSKHPLINFSRAPKKVERDDHTTSSDHQKDIPHSSTSLATDNTGTASNQTPVQLRGDSVSAVHVPNRTSAQDTIARFVNVVRPMTVQESRKIDMQLLRVICCEYQPFSIVEDKEFRKFVQMLNPA